MFCSVLLPPALTGTMYSNHTRSWPPHWTHLPWSRLHTYILTQEEGSGLPAGPIRSQRSMPRLCPAGVSPSPLADAERPVRRLNSFGTIASPLAPLASPPPRVRPALEGVHTPCE